MLKMSFLVVVLSCALLFGFYHGAPIIETELERSRTSKEYTTQLAKCRDSFLVWLGSEGFNGTALDTPSRADALVSAFVNVCWERSGTIHFARHTILAVQRFFVHRSVCYVGVGVVTHLGATS